MVPETYTVYPTNKYNLPPPPLSIALHGLDTFVVAPIQIKNHRFYHDPSIPLSELVNKLKSSLAEALELYPPVAGMVHAAENGQVYLLMGPDDIKGTPFTVVRKDTPYNGDTEDLSVRSDVILPPLSSTFAVKLTQVYISLIIIFFPQRLNLIYLLIYLQPYLSTLFIFFLQK
jgi:hypothetical protein